MSTNLNYKMFFREEEEEEEENRIYWGDAAAGILYIAKNTGRMLMGHRSRYVNEPYTWNLIGGKIDDDEDPFDAAFRESGEELGIKGETPRGILIYTNKKYERGELKFTYYNYLVLVPDQFNPKLNWEHTDYRWVEYGDWPTPLHPGFKELIEHMGHKIQRIVSAIKKNNKINIPEIMTPTAPPPAIVKSVHDFSPDFIKYIKTVENNVEAGRYKTKKGGKEGKDSFGNDKKIGYWYPHPSPEGGSYTIAYGHKLVKGDEKLKSGISQREADDLLVKDLNIAKNKVYDEIKHKYNGYQLPPPKSIHNDVDRAAAQNKEEMLVDYAYNLGTISGFHKFVDALLRNQWDIVAREYVRTYKDRKGEKHPIGRNAPFFAKYIASHVKSPSKPTVAASGKPQVKKYVSSKQSSKSKKRR